jgi:hypothetical protein
MASPSGMGSPELPVSFRLPEIPSRKAPVVPMLKLPRTARGPQDLEERLDSRGALSVRVSAENHRYERALELMASARLAAIQGSRLVQSDSTGSLSGGVESLDERKKRFDKEALEIKKIVGMCIVFRFVFFVRNAWV